MSTALSRAKSEISLGNLPAVETASLFDSEPQLTADAIERRFVAISGDPRYFQFAHIPDRIIHCLELCGAAGDRTTMRARLMAYYVFIGVVDDGIESAELETGEQILKRLANPLPCFDQSARNSRAHFMTEILKRHIGPSIQARAQLKFRDLHRANLAERSSLTIRDFIKQRKLIGSLTAELSYLLIRDCFSVPATECRRLMKDVGAIGCLVDSVVDVRSDTRAGTLSFHLGACGFLFLCGATIFDGIRLAMRYPRMLHLFGAAIRDNFRDRKRSTETSLNSRS